MVAATGRQPNEVMGEMAPLGGQATIERVAANAVMAGCGEPQFPYVMAAVEALLDPATGGVEDADEDGAPSGQRIHDPGPARERVRPHSCC